MVRPHIEYADLDTVKDSSKVFYKQDVWYTLTYNPEHQTSRKNKVTNTMSNREVYFYTTMRDLFAPMKNMDYVFHPEISEPRNNTKYTGIPRYHWHGAVRFTTIRAVRNFLLVVLPFLAQNGKYDIDVLTHPMKWHDYCHKQLDVVLDYKDIWFKPVSNFTDYKDLWKIILK